MSLTRDDLADLIHLLRVDPALRHDLQFALVANDLDVMLEPLVAAQERSQAAIDALIESGRRVDLRLEALAAAQRETEVQLKELAAALRETAARVDATTQNVDRLEARVDWLIDITAGMRGRQLEEHYARKAAAIFGRLMRRTRVVGLLALEDELLGSLSREELGDLYLVDLVVTGVPWDEPATEVWLAVEVSAIVDRSDVERSVRRSQLLARTGRSCLPAVAGEGATEGGRSLALAEGAILVQDGRIEGWDEARHHWLG